MKKAVSSTARPSNLSLRFMIPQNIDRGFFSIMKNFVISILGLCLSLCLSGCGRSDNSSTITIGVMPDVDSIPYIMALKNGYYEKRA